jgi:hypothetical protein
MEIVFGIPRVVYDVYPGLAKNPRDVMHLVPPILIVLTTKTTAQSVSEINVLKAAVDQSVITLQIVLARVTVPNVMVDLATIITGSVTPAVIAPVVLMINVMAI